MARYSPTEQIGVAATAGSVATELGWIFREQPVADMGIDAHIELVEPEGHPTGKLIGVQIKTGIGNFSETDEGYVYYGDNTHKDYWFGHALPVILVAHIPGVGTFWQAVNESTVESTRKHWKLTIPKTHGFGESSKSQLRRLFEGSASQQRLRKLALDEPLMRHIAQGGKVSLELEDWVNKSLGRSPVLVYVYDANGNETLSQEWDVFYTGLDIKGLAESLFPWAQVGIDEEFYEEHAPEESEWEKFARAQDEDNGIVVKRSKDDIYPYSDLSGEVEAYRLQLRLSRLGKAYLVIADHLAEPELKSPFDTEGRSTTNGESKPSGRPGLDDLSVEEM
jgi:hypothetical protein